MTARADSVETTRDAICEATIELWLDVPFDKLTLDSIAERAGTTRQTVLRHYGSKKGVVLAAAEWFGPRIDAAIAVEPGDLDGAVDAIVHQYEAMGDANVRMLEVEDRIPEAHELLERGRASHRQWVQATFEPFLQGVLLPDRERLVDTLYAATDVMVWKLLRRDLDRSVDDTRAVFGTLVRGALATATQSTLEGGERS